MLSLTERELNEIKLALFYERDCNHGTAGHNRLILIVKLAEHCGFELLLNSNNLVIPENVK